MLLSQLIAEAQRILNEKGDLPVCSGIDRSGYGEEVIEIYPVAVTLMGSNDKALVVDIRLSDESTYETSLEAILPDLD